MHNLAHIFNNTQTKHDQEKKNTKLLNFYFELFKATVTLK